LAEAIVKVVLKSDQLLASALGVLRRLNDTDQAKSHPIVPESFGANLEETFDVSVLVRVEIGTHVEPLV
jgi:hypothetical protein